ncbi:discoidin domain-containing protein [Micrococcus porci]|uniref:discoidin domain-containing protein n=1 Tax=Micrococcus porci TaxID=2856555 RepID=UPI001CC95E12|nr:discoidin domain-containing protein [Micrococcus porci]UBH24981.1 discoidin domain-containing protein [Micrococcus porci]
MPQPLAVGSVLGGRYRITDHVVTSADQNMVFQGADQVLNRRVTVLVASPENATQVAASARELATGERQDDVQVLDLGLSEGRTYLIAGGNPDPDVLLGLAYAQELYVEPFQTDSLGSEIFGESRTEQAHEYDDDDAYYADLDRRLRADQKQSQRRPGFLNRISEKLNERVRPADGTAAKAAAGASALAAADAATKAQLAEQERAEREAREAQERAEREEAQEAERREREAQERAERERLERAAAAQAEKDRAAREAAEAEAAARREREAQRHAEAETRRREEEAAAAAALAAAAPAADADPADAPTQAVPVTEPASTPEAVPAPVRRPRPAPRRALPAVASAAAVAASVSAEEGASAAEAAPAESVAPEAVPTATATSSAAIAVAEAEPAVTEHREEAHAAPVAGGAGAGAPAAGATAAPARSTSGKGWLMVLGLLALLALAGLAGLFLLGQNTRSVEPAPSASASSAAPSTAQASSAPPAASSSAAPTASSSAAPSTEPAPSTSAAAPAPTAAPQAVAVTRQVPEMPELEAPNDATLANLIDGDPNTAWQSYTYARPNFGGYVGSMNLVVQLQERTTISEVQLENRGATGGKWIAYVANTAQGGEGDARVIGQGTFDEDSITIPVDIAENQGQYVILSITGLPQLEGAGQRPYGLQLTEIGVR